jgi:hypothetical protein
MSEAQLQAAICDLAAWLGIWTYHNPDSRRSAAGWPDLVMVGSRGMLLRELKTATGRLRPQQQEIGQRLTTAGQDWAVWRPEDMASGRIQRELKAIQ